MTTALDEDYATVHRALGTGPHESVLDAAIRALQIGDTGTNAHAYSVAREMLALNDTQAQVEGIRRAAVFCRTLRVVRDRIGA
jgi:hypothetical protein